MALAELSSRIKAQARNRLVARETSARFERGDFAENEMLKIAGGNYLDDGFLFEADGPEGVDRVKASLVEMDQQALAIRKGLNGLVRKALEACEGATQMGMEKSYIQDLKPAASQLLTAYTKVVSMLQQAREDIGYDPGEASVTSLETESLLDGVDRVLRAHQHEEKATNFVDLSWDSKTRTVRMSAPKDHVEEDTFWQVAQTVKGSMRGHATYAAAATVGKNVVGEVRLSKDLQGEDLKKAAKALGVLVKTELHNRGLTCS